MTKLIFQIMCVTVVQWSRSCLNVQINRVRLPATLFSVFFLPSFFLFGLHKLSRHVPPLKQLNFFNIILVDIMTNNTEYTTNCTNLHPTSTSDPLTKVKLEFVHRLNQQYYYPKISTGSPPPKKQLNETFYCF